VAATELKVLVSGLPAQAEPQALRPSHVAAQAEAAVPAAELLRLVAAEAVVALVAELPVAVRYPKCSDWFPLDQ